MKQQYGVDSMPETGENVAEEYQVARARPGRLCAALAAARRQGHRVGLFRRGDRRRSRCRAARPGPVIVDKDEHPRPDTTLEGLAKLKPFVRNPGT